MGKVRFGNARVWRYVVSSISRIVEEATCTFKSEGLRLRAIDPSHVVMVDLEFLREAFDEYKVEEGEKISFSLEDLNKILRRARKGDNLYLEWEDGRLKVGLVGRMERIFSIPMPRIEEEALPEANLPFKIKAKMLGRTFRESIMDIEPVADTIALEGRSGVLLISGSSERGRAIVELSLENGSLLDIEVEEEGSSKYSVEYVKDTLPLTQVADIVEVAFSKDMPCRVKYEFAEDAQVSFLIAPRVE